MTGLIMRNTHLLSLSIPLPTPLYLIIPYRKLWGLCRGGSSAAADDRTSDGRTGTATQHTGHAETERGELRFVRPGDGASAACDHSLPTRMASRLIPRPAVWVDGAGRGRAVKASGLGWASAPHSPHLAIRRAQSRLALHSHSWLPFFLFSLCVRQVVARGRGEGEGKRRGPGKAGLGLRSG